MEVLLRPEKRRGKPQWMSMPNPVEVLKRLMAGLF
jgi:hypothetical protein